jgi:hypothetical protein
MPFGQSVNGTHGTLDPTPAASLAPTAVYVMLAPGAGGFDGPVGFPFELLSQLSDESVTSRSAAIRRIGEMVVT